MPKTSGTAHARAHPSTCTRGWGEVSRLATRASITWPWVRMATSRTGQTRSTMPAMSRRRQNSATTGRAPSALSMLGGPYWMRCVGTMLLSQGYLEAYMLQGIDPRIWR